MYWAVNNFNHQASCTVSWWCISQRQTDLDSLSFFGDFSGPAFLKCNLGNIFSYILYHTEINECKPFLSSSGGRAADDHRLWERGQPVRHSRGLLRGKVSDAFNLFSISHQLSSFLALSALFPIEHKMLTRFSATPRIIHPRKPKMKASHDSEVIYIILFITGGSSLHIFTVQSNFISQDIVAVNNAGHAAAIDEY